MDKSWMTTRQVASALGWGPYRSDEVNRLIGRGEIAAEKDLRRWRVSPEEVARLTAIHHGFVDLADAGDVVRKLRDRVAELERELAKTTASYRDTHRLAAADALSALSLDECLEILGRYDTVPMTNHQRYELYEAKQRVIEQLDRRDHQGALGDRPSGVPDRATSRRLATGIGPVDVWVWRTPKGWAARHGGPRPGSRYAYPDRRSATSSAVLQARSTYGKPNRRQSVKLRFLILERDQFTCRYCGRKAPDVELAVDHAVSLADGGLDTEDNLVTACRDCNAGKSGRSVPIA